MGLEYEICNNVDIMKLSLKKKRKTISTSQDLYLLVKNQTPILGLGWAAYLDYYPGIHHSCGRVQMYWAS